MREIAAKAKGTIMLLPDANAVDRAKWELCKQFILHMHRKKLSQRQLAKILNVPESRVSEVCHYRLNKLTLDRLVRYYECIKPNVMFKVA